MKRKLLLCAAVCATFSVFPQNSKLSPSGKENLKPLIKAEINENPLATTVQKTKVSTVNPAPAQNSASKISAVNTWSNISTSSNIYGVLISYCKPLQYNDELNAVSFIHRRPVTYLASPLPAATAASGLMIAAVSGDFGNNWDTTLIWNDNNNWARYPGGAIYNPAGNTLLSAAYVVGAGPTTAAAGGWPGNFYASKSLSSFNNIASTTPNAQQWMDITNPNPNVGRHDFAAYGYSATDDGKLRNLAGIMDDGTGADTALLMITGSFNSGVFAYTGTRFNPPTTVDGIGDDNFVSRPAMAWNEAGTVGYMAVNGQRLGATGRNTGLQPMVWKTTNSGASWAAVAGIDFNAPAYSSLVYNLTAQGTSTLEVPNFLWTEGFDMAVDANNKLHLFSVLVGHYSVDPDSLSFVSTFTSDDYRWPHTPGLRPYLYDFMTDGSSAWTYNTVDSMSSEGCSDNPANAAAFAENPWTLNGANKVRLDARLQLSRTPNGKYIFYAWGESDTNFTNNTKKFNVKPNIKVRAYGVDENLVSSNEVNVSGGSGSNPNIDQKAFYHFMSPKSSSATVAVVNATLTTISAKTPFTISNSPGFDQLSSNTHWYNTTQSSFSFTPKGVSVAENALNSTNTSFVYPNPASDNTSLSIELKNNDKVELTVFNLMGQSLLTYDVDGQAGQNIINMDISSLKTGIYMVNVKVVNASSTKKLIVE